MELLHRIAAERECERLTYRYCEAVDFGHASRLADVFAADGVFEAGGLHLVGQEEIRRVFAERELVRELRTLHVCSNLRVDVLDEVYGHRRRLPHAVPPARVGGLVRARPDDRPAVIGSYHDHYVRTADGWRIASRRQEVVFVDPADTGWSPVAHDPLPHESS